MLLASVILRMLFNTREGQLPNSQLSSALVTDALTECALRQLLKYAYVFQIVLDIHTTFGSFDRPALCRCLSDGLNTGRMCWLHG